MTDQNANRLFLYPDEVTRLYEATKKVSNPDRAKLALKLMYYHGLRVSELINLKWCDVNFNSASIYIHRAKGSNDCIHSIPSDELRLLRKVKKNSSGVYIIYNIYKPNIPVCRYTINKLITKLVKIAELDIDVHPHMFRHSCGYALAEKSVPLREIQDYLGHKNVNNTVHYTRLNPNKSRNYF